MSSAPFLHHLQDLEPSVDEFRDAVLRGLATKPKTLPCKFFYDAAGSQLFDQICDLPEYYPTRTELTLLKVHAGEIATLVGTDAKLVEFGSGAGIKVRLLLDALSEPAAYVPVDISRAHLIRATAALAQDFPWLRITPVCADYTHSFALPHLTGLKSQRNVGFFPGSTIGNFTPPEATEFLRRTARLLGHGSMMIIGVDMPKDSAILHAAYNDRDGITAAFNLNLLHRINRELAGDFTVDAFDHKAHWNQDQSRIEMHLVSRSRQAVHIGGHQIEFHSGETIHTENSYKYAPETFGQIAAAAGYQTAAVWLDPDALFSIHLLQRS